MFSEIGKELSTMSCFFTVKLLAQVYTVNRLKEALTQKRSANGVRPHMYIDSGALVGGSYASIF